MQLLLQFQDFRERPKDLGLPHLTAEAWHPAAKTEIAHSLTRQRQFLALLVMAPMRVAPGIPEQRL
eukprot:CAMPEP_0177445028 /NCGR_PEP_ID=MMETSP0369-20130122/6317_1 /TAXON_ID=447022 ORGANISM="Scrippsiella hangoei-like, Strain SHHI-4" /NCGR_SAMPLE_ID=MMETSP0369 /ASSEMBLY_ACC=CAM_ASM_000364 /LENGTH=65 /DNA_ID=CAMNT_0018917129 /DNA_START=100 /DNA_END=293 /DNA_ORIENTATION=-